MNTQPPKTPNELNKPNEPSDPKTPIAAPATIKFRQPRGSVLVTGASGFVGRKLCHALIDQGREVRALVRRPNLQLPSQCTQITSGDLTQFLNWAEAIAGVEAVVHLVARTHMTDEFGNAAMQRYREVNVDITRRLARAARERGVRRFVYLSSIKVVGNASAMAMHEGLPCRPVDSYGMTKWEAEQVLRRQLLGSGTSYTILRPPLVYGPGVRGNFLRLLRFVQRGIPFPAIHNRRTMVHVENLVDAICRCLEHPAALDQTFHVADTSSISTAELMRAMARGMDKRIYLVPMPALLLRMLGRLAGRREETRRLVDSLAVSAETIRRRLDWQPPWDVTDGVEATSRAFACEDWSQTVENETPKTESIDRRAA